MSSFTPWLLVLAVCIIIIASVVLAQQYKEFVLFELCARTPEHSRDHEKLYLRKKHIGGIQLDPERDDCVIISSELGRKVRVYGTIEDVINKLQLPDE